MLCEAFGEHSLSWTAVFNGIHISRAVNRSWQSSGQRMMFWNSVWHPNGIASGTRQHRGKWLPWRSWSVVKMMGSLYTYPRRLLWKRWQTKLMKLSQHFFA
jgi:hypothetical protein